jgi:hypothetical protein
LKECNGWPAGLYTRTVIVTQGTVNEGKKRKVKFVIVVVVDMGVTVTAINLDPQEALLQSLHMLLNRTTCWYKCYISKFCMCDIVEESEAHYLFVYVISLCPF